MNTLSSSEYEALFNDINSRMASSRLSKRYSRSSGVQTPNRASARIEKPRSTNPSPRRIERRRTTASVKPYVSLDDHYNAMLGPGRTYDDASDVIGARLQPEYLLARPMSWHPTSFQVSQPPVASLGNLPPTVYASDTSTGYGLNQTNAESPLALEGNRPSKPTRSETTPYMSHSKDNEADALKHQPSAAAQMTRATWCVSPNTFTPLSYSQPNAPLGIGSFYTSSKQFTLQSPTDFSGKQFSTLDSAAEADDFLPLQRPASCISSSPVPERKDLPAGVTNGEEDYPLDSFTSVDHNSHELVGMGLYDSPERDESIVRTGLPQEAKGKGLKLEETWKPPRGLLLPEDHEEHDDASLDSGSNASNGTEAGINDQYDDLVMDEEMDVMTQPSQDNFFLPIQPSSSMASTIATFPADMANVAPLTGASGASAAASAGIIPASTSVPMPMLASARLPSSLAGRSFFFEEDEGNTRNRGVDMWYSQLRPAAQTATLGTVWY